MRLLIVVLLVVGWTACEATVGTGTGTPVPLERWTVTYNATQMAYIQGAPYIHNDVVFSVLGGKNTRTYIQANSRVNGKFLWEVYLGQGYNLYSTPTVVAVNDTLVASTAAKTFAYSISSGAQLWVASWEGPRKTPVPINRTGTMIAYTLSHLFAFSTATGKVVWKTSGQFGQESFFTNCMYGEGAKSLVCPVQDPTTGMNGIGSYDVSTGVQNWFHSTTNPSPFYVNNDTVAFMDLNATQFIKIHVWNVDTGVRRWSYQCESQHAAAGVFNDSVIVGTWTSVGALDWHTGKLLWLIPEPTDTTTFLSHPFACNGGVVLIHEQLDENYRDNVRRVDPKTGKILWKLQSYLNTNGFEQYHCAAGVNMFVGRTPHNVYGIDMTSGAQMLDVPLRESMHTGFGGDMFFYGDNTKLNAVRIQ